MKDKLLWLSLLSCFLLTQVYCSHSIERLSYPAPTLKNLPKHIKRLHSKDDRIVRDALACIEQIGPQGKEAIPELINILGSDNNLNIILASSALGAMRREGKIAIPNLINIYNKNGDNRVKDSIINALAGVGYDEDACNLLNGILSDDSVPLNLMISAARALGWYGSEGTCGLNILMYILKERAKYSDDLIFMVLWAIGEIRPDKQEILEILDEISKENKLYSHSAKESLDKIRNS